MTGAPTNIPKKHRLNLRGIHGSHKFLREFSDSPSRITEGITQGLKASGFGMLSGGNEVSTVFGTEFLALKKIRRSTFRKTCAWETPVML